MTARRGDVQGLRGIAVLLVIGFHLFGFPRGGYIGVDVFFVISGYVITAGLLREAERDGTISLRRFYGRRFYRIAPAAALTVAAVVAATALLPVSHRAAAYTDSLWAVLGGTDFRMMILAAAGGEGFTSPVGHFWSLAVEEQFYLVWPAVMLLAWTVGRRRGSPRRWLLGAALAVAAVSLTVGAWSNSVDAAVAYQSPAARGWELAVGVVTATLVPRFARLGRRTRLAVAFGGAAAVEVGCFAWTQAAFPVVPGGVLPVAGAAALIVAGTGGATVVTSVLESRLLRRVGDLSYSLYLWHFPVLIFLAVLQPGGSWDVVLEAVALTVLLAWLSYRFVERPFLDGRVSRWSAPRRPRSTASPASAPTPSPSTP